MIIHFYSHPSVLLLVFKLKGDIRVTVIMITIRLRLPEFLVQIFRVQTTLRVNTTDTKHFVR